MGVPSYFYPGAYWTQLMAGAPRAGLAIVNPASGPGTSADANYVSQVSQARAKGVLVVGYVDTSYGQRTLAVVKAEVDRHFQWYGVDGIFFDQATNDCRNTSYYQQLFDYVKGKSAAAKVVLNPGTKTVSDCYMASTDIIITFESTYSTYLTWQPSAWEASYPANRFWHLIYTTSQSQLPNAVALSRQRNAGWVYVTDDSLPNPWDTVPNTSYWNLELQLAAQ